MPAEYDFNLTADRVGVDTQDRDGYKKSKDGSEDGGLWFERKGDTLQLVDFDGAGSLPPAIVSALRGLGLEVSDDFC